MTRIRSAVSNHIQVINAGKRGAEVRIRKQGSMFVIETMDGFVLDMVSTDHEAVTMISDCEWKLVESLR